MKTLVLTIKGGQVKKIQIPDDAKVTYGMICPGSKSDRYNAGDGSGSGYGLRVYGKNKEDQLACFSGVIEWRVEDIKVLKKERKSAVKHVAVVENGIEKLKKVTATTETWIDEDDAPEDGEAAGFIDSVACQLKDSDDESYIRSL